MPVGNGNDVCNTLGFGCNLGINYLHKYFEQINNSKDVKLTQLDCWNFVLKREGKKIMERSFLAYVGIGHDAETCYNFDIYRKIFPCIFGIKKLNKLHYALSFMWMFVKNILF